MYTNMYGKNDTNEKTGRACHIGSKYFYIIFKKIFVISS